MQQQLEESSHAFFALPEEEKMAIAMSKGGRAWRGYFPVEGELTSGKPDLKEGLYFGQEGMNEDDSVKAGWPLHGRNQFPKHPLGLQEAVLRYMEAMEQTAHAVMRGIALSLGLPPTISIPGTPATRSFSFASFTTRRKKIMLVGSGV